MDSAEGRLGIADVRERGGSLAGAKIAPKNYCGAPDDDNARQIYCNIKALNPTERAHHKELTDKLIAARKDTVEMEKGYEFQFFPANVSLAELADWVAAEGKCCPFFDFQIDLEHTGKLLCLLLTGEEGIKQFIRVEFQVPTK